MQGQEPSDAIRVVNALLTQIDHIKRYLKEIHHHRQACLWRYVACTAGHTAHQCCCNDGARKLLMMLSLDLRESFNCSQTIILFSPKRLSKISHILQNIYYISFLCLKALWWISIHCNVKLSLISWTRKYYWYYCIIISIFLYLFTSGFLTFSS